MDIKVCCENCFSDKYLKEWIIEWDQKDDCNYCNSKNSYCVNVDLMVAKFKPLLEIYDIADNVLDTDEVKEIYDSVSQETIFDKLHYEWQIFNIDDDAIVMNLVKDIFSNSEYNNYLTSHLIEDYDISGTSSKFTENLKQKWKDFCFDIINNNRYFSDKTFNLEVLESLAPALSTLIEKEKVFYRARLSTNQKKFPTYSMGKPPKKNAISGRANPKGIPYLYLSSDKLTCIKEMRPKISDYITVGYFKCIAPLNLINLNTYYIDSPFKYEYDFRNIVYHMGFLRVLNDEVSKPKESETDDLIYIPIQYIVEFFKKLGFDGVIYKSTVSDGLNYALFDEQKVQCYKTEKCSIEISIRNNNC